MAFTLSRWTPLRRYQMANPATSAAMVTLPGGIPAWELETGVGDLSHTGLEIGEDMHATYAGETLTYTVVWTVPPGASGNLTLTANFRRIIDGVNPSSPYSGQRSLANIVPPAAYTPKRSQITFTQAQTAPLFPGGLGGVQAREHFSTVFSRTTTPNTSIYVIAVELALL